MSDAETTSSAQGSPFWRFSLRFYRLPEVAEACIRLQEESEVDVNLLMYLFWRASQHRAFTADEVAWFESKIAPWRECVVIPLRGVRRALKAPPLVASAVAEPFRTRIKAVELEAERLQQEAMYEITPVGPTGIEESSIIEAARTNVAAYAYAQALGVEFAPDVVERLLTAFGTLGTAADPVG